METKGAQMHRIVCISDTHGQHKKLKLPEGDILIHAGDICAGRGSRNEVEKFNEWLGELNYSHIICIAGNHDFPLVHYHEEAHEIMSNCIYLKDEEVVIDGIKFYGSPWQPWFHSWAFNLQRGPEIAKKWAMIPDDTDILITHGPPYGYGDETMWSGHVGCRDLLDRINIVKPKVNIFGHIHEGYGVYNSDNTTFINASSVGDIELNKPIVLDI